MYYWRPRTVFPVPAVPKMQFESQRFPFFFPSPEVLTFQSDNLMENNYFANFPALRNAELIILFLGSAFVYLNGVGGPVVATACQFPRSIVGVLPLAPCIALP